MVDEKARTAGKERRGRFSMHVSMGWGGRAAKRCNPANCKVRRF
jgi:hypothetical protein